MRVLFQSRFGKAVQESKVDMAHFETTRFHTKRIYLKSATFQHISESDPLRIVERSLKTPISTSSRFYY